MSHTADTIFDTAHPHPSTPIHDTPVPPPNRRLWSSPAFSQHSHSDYYSGEDADLFSPDGSLNKSAHSSFSHSVVQPLNSQNQRVLLERLAGIAKAIVASSYLTEHHFHLINQDVDRLEQTIAAPDSQTREPADIAQSNLFEDDEDEDDVTEVATEQDTKLNPVVLPPVHNEADGMIDRVVMVAENLKKRLLETKKQNRQAESIIRDLKYELAEHEAKHAELYDEVSQYHTDFLYLKLSLKSLEVRVDTDMNPKIRNQFLLDIDRWKGQWKKSTERIRARRMGNKAAHDSTIDDDSLSLKSWGSSRKRIFMNASPRSKGGSRTNSISNGSPRSPKSPSMTLRPAPTHRHVSAPILTEMEEKPRGTERPELVQEEEVFHDEHGSATDDQTVVEEEEEAAPQTTVTKWAWEQLWDDLADFAGIRDPDY